MATDSNHVAAVIAQRPSIVDHTTVEDKPSSLAQPSSQGQASGDYPGQESSGSSQDLKKQYERKTSAEKNSKKNPNIAKELKITQELAKLRWTPSDPKMTVQLALTGLALDDNDIKILAERIRKENRGLTLSLKLSCNKITVKGAKILASLFESCLIERLYLDENRIGNDGIHAILLGIQTSRSQILKLTLGKNMLFNPLTGVSEVLNLEVAKTLATILRNQSLSILVLRGNKICSTGITEIAKGIRDSTTLNGVDLSETWDGGGLIGGVFLGKNMRTVILENNFFNKDEIADIFRNIISMKVQEVYLGNSGSNMRADLKGPIDAEVAAVIGMALKGNLTLRVLKLDGNPFSRSGMEIFASMFPDAGLLRDLGLSHTFCHTLAAERLAEAAASSSLERLDLGFNAIGDEAIPAFRTALAENRDLTHLNLEANAIWILGW